MPKFRLSPPAKADLKKIVAHTLNTWGEPQAVRYLEDFESRLQMLADNPGLGRPCDHIRPGLLRFEHASHVIFFRRKARGIAISRILYERMLPDRRRFLDERSE